MKVSKFKKNHRQTQITKSLIGTNIPIRITTGIQMQGIIIMVIMVTMVISEPIITMNIHTRIMMIIVKNLENRLKKA